MMWKDPDPDPGGDTQEAPPGKSLQELTDLKEQNEQQQLLIAQLKEMLRKEQSNVTQEKVDEYINTLSKAKAKKNRAKRDESGSLERSVGTSSSGVDTAKKQKLNLLKQQMEENKARLAERGKSQKGIEEMVSQLKAQLNDSQQLIPTNISVIEVKNLEYSKSSSQEELYNILITKERRITDLLNKVQKQEVTILDLEENLKEKDSVIDARTKAITLMTDSLSKKGKSTLDALDDTKEQMRKMQENFITLESEMKARQVKLLNDLKAKNFEIAELQDANQKLLEEKMEYSKIIDEFKNRETEGEISENEEYKNTIINLKKQLDESLAENKEILTKNSELEKKLQESIDDFNRLKNTGLSVSTEQSNDEEISKLKKQLDENNKNMIKVKAQSKSKIKELNKKLDQIKKASDANALIVQLQNENTKLSEKVAELEEEKGNMQLKMVESSDSAKDSSLVEEQKELENKLEKYSDELEEKDKVISLLETEIISLKEEINQLNEKVTNLSHLENVQVSSEMNSIQLEEELERAEIENQKLKGEIELLLKKKEELIEEVEELKKEKQEINSKLDNYIQENIELIDKLEKLSAEKVSSAESIEIVEGLTQQEKLELAAYQKTIDVHMEGEPMKCHEEDQLEPPIELNESVHQLNEDSTELLQKIDMFNMERKEVMSKMEALKDENNQLNLKLKEIENNRDILAETYEQLQTEKEELQNENYELIKKLQVTSENKLKEESLDDEYKSVALVKMQELQRVYDNLLAENDSLKQKVKEYDMHIQEKHNLESELKEAKDKIVDFESKIHTNLEEITNYQIVIEENKNELINSANLINKLQTKLEEREKDIADLNVIINDLNSVVNNLQVENRELSNFEVMETQVTDLKTALNDQIQQAQDYEEEISRNNDIITDLNTKLIELNKRMIETEHEMEMKDIEYRKLSQDLQVKNDKIENLHRQMEEKDRHVSVVIQDMKEKYLSLQKQLDGNSGSLEDKITALTNKNKEQMDKMKKIAANLKKKSQAYHELEEKYKEEKEKWETEVNEKESAILNSQDKIATILQQLQELQEEVRAKNEKLMNSDAKISELTEIIQSLDRNKMELQNAIAELKYREQKLSEVSLKQELSTSLHEDFDNVPTNQDSVNEEKIKELELIIETNETDIAHYNERVHKLEEDIARLEQEKEDLIKQTIELNNQLSVTSQSVEEKSFAEEELGQRLLQVTANDEILMKKLEESTEENKELSQKNKEIEEMNIKLKIKLKKAHERVTQLKNLQSNMEELESTNNELKKQLAVLEANQKHIQDENLELQKQNQSDYEKIEADYQTQLEELVRHRNELAIECEKLRERLKEMEQREEELIAEVTEYKQKIEEIEASNKEKLGELADELRIANYNWKDSMKEVEVLNQQLDQVQKELIFKIAQETIETIVTEAEDRIRTSATISSQTEKEEPKEIVERKVITENRSTQSMQNESTVGSQTDKDETVEVVESKVATENRSTQSIQNEVEIVPNQQEIVPTFHWPDGQQIQQSSQEVDWFGNSVSNVPSNQSNNEINLSAGPLNPFTSGPQPDQPLVIENSKEELLHKIRALEFLLYNIDKEKEEAFEECTGMVNELTRLVYEKVNAPDKEKVIASTESTNLVPLPYIESLIMSDADITDAASNKKALQSIEFEKTEASLGEQSRPVIEEVMQPKRAYLTYQPDEKSSGGIKPEAFGENDDGWGWGPEEAKLEEEHQFQTESVPQMQNLRSEISRLNEALQVLQVERENHLEEIKQLQVKSGKLIKKCKDLKQKNDQLMEKQQNKKAEGADFFDLDATIQEELKTQIAQLEKKIKEITNELEKEKQEKSNTLKRVDVLTSANERMMEMKEIQDTEVLHWKRKYQEAEEKLQQHEWGSDGFNEGIKQTNMPQTGQPSSSNNKEIEELQQTIRDLSLDNEELQALLEEQRQIRISLETKVKKLPHNDEKEEHDISILKNKIKDLEQELVIKSEEIEKILNDRNTIYTQNELLQKEIINKEDCLKTLHENLANHMEKNNELQKLLADAEKSERDLQESEKWDTIQKTLTGKINELEVELAHLNQELIQKNKLLHEKEVAVNEHFESLKKANMLKEELMVQVKQLTNDLEQQRQNYSELLAESSNNISKLNDELVQEKANFNKLKEDLEENIKNTYGELDRQKQINEQLQADITVRLSHLSQELEGEKQRFDVLQKQYNEKNEEVAKLSQELQSKQQESSAKDTFEWAQEKYQLECLAAEKDAACVKLRTEKEALEKQIDELKLRLDEKQSVCERLVKETEDTISKTVKELENTWIIQVDQGGADVAESWKQHLETVEADYASIHEKLRFEINELEERCNALVNENNELRKNVDAEIRNEVDRISALQQQITDGQRHITELNNSLLGKQTEIDTLKVKVTVIESEKEQLLNNLKDKENKLSSLTIIADTTQKQFDEKREVVEEIVRILEKNTNFPISFEKEDILREFQKQLDLIKGKDQEIHKLHQLVESLQSQFSSIDEKEKEILKLNETVRDLQQQLEALQEKDTEIYRLKKLVEDSQHQLILVHEKDEELMNMHKLVEDLQKQLLSVNDKDNELYKLNNLVSELQGQLSYLQEKDDEIYRLNQVIEHYKVQQSTSQQEVDQLHQEQVTANMAAENYKQKLDEYNTAYMTLQETIEEKNQLIETLNQQLKLTETLKNDNNQDVEKLQEEILQIKNDCSVLQQSLADCQEQLFTVTNELTNRTNQLEQVNQQLAYSQHNFQIQEGELNKLRELLQSKELEYSNTLENLRKTHFRDLENHYEELLSAKDLDIETIRSQLNESIHNSNQLFEKLSVEEGLRQQMEDKVKSMEEKLAEQSTLLDEEDKQLTEMRSIIEQQVIKIEELKKELFVKSSDYDSLIAEMDIGRKAITQQPTHSISEKPTTSERLQSPEEDLSEPVSRAELDLALYMLHQRDVRCEELTVELTQLLEERDTLQLRLSNAIREKEEIRRKLTGAEELSVPSTSTSPPATPHSKTSAIFLAASGTELATEHTESANESQNLEMKLSELKRVGYKKDKTFVDEQQFRRLQQMSIMQQHINEASKLPPEAAAKLVDASYTLSRDVQSPSKVLLNWLWGRSTPKVNDS